MNRQRLRRTIEEEVFLVVDEELLGNSIAADWMKGSQPIRLLLMPKASEVSASSRFRGAKTKAL